MILRNNTPFDVKELLESAFADFSNDGLTIELKYCPKGSRRYISGTYYRRTKGYENGKFIRIRINRNNKYPLSVHFKTSEYFIKRNLLGKETKYQKLRTCTFERPEDLILAVFAHEFSHYLDHLQGLNGRYKETKADKFAACILEKLDLLPRTV